MPTVPRLLPALVLAVFGLAACGNGDAPGTPGGAAPGARAAGGPGGPGGPGPGGPIAVVTATVQPTEFSQEIEALGTAGANEAVEITSKVSNVITAIRFAEGQRVQAGTVLVELDAAQVRADLAAAEAALDESRAQAERSRALAATAALSGSQVDQIEATLKANEARVARARIRMIERGSSDWMSAASRRTRNASSAIIAERARCASFASKSPVQLCTIKSVRHSEFRAGTSSADIDPAARHPASPLMR